MPKIVQHIYALALIVFGWVIFYFSDDVGGFKALAEFVPTLFSGALVSRDALANVLSYLPSLIIGCVTTTPIIRNLYDKLKDKKGFIVFETIAVAIILVLCTASLVNNAYNPFLYFKF